jgi:hypothetical protein
VVGTRLLVTEALPRQELAWLNRAPWPRELDLRSIKQVMRMDVLGCRAPATVRKEKRIANRRG